MVVWWWFTQVQSNKQHRTTLNKSKYYVCVSPVSTYFHNHLQLKIVGAYPPFGHHTEGDAPTPAPQIQQGKWFVEKLPKHLDKNIGFENDVANYQFLKKTGN